MSSKISVNQIEGLDIQSQSTGCYLSVNGDFIDVITPISSNSRGYLTELPPDGQLKLILKNMRTGEVIGSLSIPIPALPSGTFWLPLYSDLSADPITEVPSEARPPRVEVTITTEDLPLTPLLTLSTEKPDQRFSKLQDEYEAALARAEARDSQNLQKIEELLEKQIDFQKAISRLTHSLSVKDAEIAQLRERNKKLMIENWESEYLTYKQSAESLQEELGVSKGMILKLNQDLQESNELALSLSSINLSPCFHQDEIQKLNSQVFALKQTIVELQRCKKSEKLEGELIKQIKEMSDKLELAELAKQDLLAEISEMRSEMMIQEKLITEMRGFIEGSRSERLSLRERVRSPSGNRRKDSIDRSLEEYHVGQGIKNHFVKLGRGLYEFGNRKVNVSMKNGSIICRVGGGYVQIDDFLNIYLSAVNGSPKKNSRGGSTSPARRWECSSGKQTPSVIDSVFDEESLWNYSCDSEESRSKGARKIM